MAILLLPVSHRVYIFCAVGTMPGQYDCEKTEKDNITKCTM